MDELDGTYSDEDNEAEAEIGDLQGMISHVTVSDIGVTAVVRHW